MSTQPPVKPGCKERNEIKTILVLNINVTYRQNEHLYKSYLFGTENRPRKYKREKSRSFLDQLVSCGKIYKTS